MPPDPFDGDPDDPTPELAALDDPDDASPPLLPAERESVLEDLEDLDVFAALLEPRGVRGLVVDCADCGEEHFFGWDLLRANLRHLLDSGVPRVHEPACEPDPSSYVTWEYARGYADGVLAAEETADR
jgi:hypothetical protein